MALNIDKEIAKMERMTVGELQEKFADVHGEEPRSRNKVWLIKRTAWRMQANEEGGLSERALRRAAALANDADLRLTAPRKSAGPATHEHGQPEKAIPVTLDARLPMPGTLITRHYKGRKLQVEVLCDGFTFEGEHFRSLSAVAKSITGSHWNGFHFFGLSRKAAPT